MVEENKDSLENNLPMVNYIMLHRIYDILTLLALNSSKNPEDIEKVNKMIEYHKEGYLLGPSPSYRSEDANE